jgi:hypothetical protein
MIDTQKSPGKYSPPDRSDLFKVHCSSDSKSVCLTRNAVSKKASSAELLTSKNGWINSIGLVEVMWADNGAQLHLGLEKPVSVR